MIRFFQSLYLSTRFFALLGGLAGLFFLSWFLSSLFLPALSLLTALGLLLVADLYALYRIEGLDARREMADKFSNGDPNPVRIRLLNLYPFRVILDIIDEVPVQFQARDQVVKTRVAAGMRAQVSYELRPTRRGEYAFGILNIYAATGLGLVQRRYRFGKPQTVKVYPSYMQMRQYELLAISNRLQEAGIKKLRNLGQSMEFEKIREYVEGDDYRNLNWKATARRGGNLMVNQYREERSQPVYCILDKGRAMRMPFAGMSLLDYAINASLVVSAIALYKQDRAGLGTFSEKMGVLLPASRQATQMHQIQELLYNQKTRYLEPDYSTLYANIRRKIPQRSMILLFTNFETLSGMQRQLPYLRKIARDHLLVVLFFENTELRSVLDDPAYGLEQSYLKIIAEKYAWEKRQIVAELEQNGIHAILSTPAGLTVNALNKYLEIKARGLL